MKRFLLCRGKSRGKKGHGPIFLAIVPLCFMGMLYSAELKAQTGQLITLEMPQATAEQLIEHIAKTTRYRFTYLKDDLPTGRRDFSFRDTSIGEVMDNVVAGTNLQWEFRNGVILIKKARQEVRQPKVLTGNVRDQEGRPMAGVSIVIRGTQRGTTTDAQGTFSIAASDGDIMIFTFLGMLPQEVAVSGQAHLNVVMQEIAEEIGEVIVTGYQTMRKSDVVGSVATVHASDIMMPAYTSIDQMLQGRVAGMVVMNTSSRIGTNPKIRVRGTSTILGNQEPLWVVDGIIQPDPLPINQNDIMVDDLKNILGNQISWLNPSDIETITVLKDASATAIYGSKAANGVIVITTKRGKEGDRISVNYNSTFSFRSRPHYGLFNLMNSGERIQFSREAFEEGAVYTNMPIASLNTYEGIMRMLYEKEITESQAQDAIYRLESVNTDWLKILTQNSFSHNHNLSISGGGNKVVYNASMGYSDQSGVEINNNGKNLSGRLNIGVQLHPKLRVDLNLAGAINNTSGYAANVNPLGYATGTSRSVPAYNEDGSYHYQIKRGYYTYNGDPHYLGYNILNEIDHSYSKNKSTQLNATLNLGWDILPGLKYEFVGGISNNTGLSESYAGEQTYYIANTYRGYDYGTEVFGSQKYNAAALPFGGELYNRSSDIQSWNIQNKLTYQKAFAQHHRINVMIGTEAFSTNTSNKSQTIYGYVKERGETIIRPTPLEELQPIGYARTTGWGILDRLYNGTGWTRTSLRSNQFSIFSILAYSLKNRYVLNASMRNDASNRFGQDQNKRFDPTFSFGLSWNVALEPWMEFASRIINQLNIRASYGIQGNSVNTISPELILAMGGVKQGYGEYMSTISRLPNPNLSWEKTKSWNFGLDLQLVQWISMSLEYYTKSSNNIVNQAIALEYGFQSMEINGGRITNSGIEYTLNITPVRSKDWGWTIGLNSGKNWNKAKTQSIGNITMRNYLAGSSDRVLREGSALSSFWSFDFRGINGVTGLPEFNRLFETDENGNFVVGDNGKYVLRPAEELTDLLVYSGTTEPDFSGGLTTRLRWKNLTFGANFSLQLGAHKRLPTLFPDHYGNIPLSDVNLSKDLMKRWKQSGDENATDIPGIYTGRVENVIHLQDGRSTFTWHEMWESSSARVVNASFFRCQQMSLTWNMNENWCEKIGVRSLSLNAIVNNVFVIADKKFNGFDPELGNSIQPKIYSLGISVGF